MDGNLRLLLSAEQIAARVGELAGEIGRDYAGRPPVLLGVLKGAFVFLADLARRLPFPVQVDFVQTSHYGRADRQGVELLYRPRLDLGGCHVLIVEDIADSGATLRALRGLVGDWGAASVEVCALLLRQPFSAPEEEALVRYVGFRVAPGWLVGYGLDSLEQHRTYPAIYLLEEGAK